ncbi:hypothetical protein O3P69_004429 [Scylla paramamosain]|uniref:C2H2-type domain-containing protein n=1 Tax=Scylla paramamosain TaxID=85552 RepID=A0AAW0UFJ1_SCYPA
MYLFRVSKSAISIFIPEVCTAIIRVLKEYIEEGELGLELKGELGTDLGLELKAGLEQGCENVELGLEQGCENVELGLEQGCDNVELGSRCIDFKQEVIRRMGTNDCWSYLASLGVHHYAWHDPLLAEGLAVCTPLNKTPCIDVDEEEFFHPSVDSLVCNVGGCKKTFTTVADYAAHQRSCHQHVCSSCKQSFPTHHLLDLHLLEAHDTLFQLMAEKNPQYQCFLETCQEKFRNPTERKTHCIEAHKFPSNFRFDTLGIQEAL